jgi:polyisoprenoid-binding protein YceI
MLATAKLFIASVAATTILSTPVANASAWMVDASHTRVGFAVRHFFTPVDGHFERFDVKLDWDRSDVSKSKVEAKISVASVNTANAKRDAHLRTPDFFDAAKFPEITFLSRSIRAVDATHFVASGDLTMRGVTKRVDMPITLLGVKDIPPMMQEMLMGAKRVASFDGQLVIDRRDFAIGTGTWAETAIVGSDVTISIKLESMEK